MEEQARVVKFNGALLAMHQPRAKVWMLSQSGLIIFLTSFHQLIAIFWTKKYTWATKKAFIPDKGQKLKLLWYHPN